MEKLLLFNQTKGGNYADNLTGQRKKKFAIAMGATANIFCKHTGTAKKSTVFRMYYLSQPIQGLLLKTSQLFSGRVIFQLNICARLTKF